VYTPAEPEVEATDPGEAAAEEDTAAADNCRRAVDAALALVDSQEARQPEAPAEAMRDLATEFGATALEALQVCFPHL
jgi:hypothetical protein